MFSWLLNGFTSQPARGACSRRKATFRPQVECLEERIVMDQSFRYWTPEAIASPPVALGSFECLHRQASDFKVVIDWGDGQKTQTQPTEPHNDFFEVKAGHLYENEGPYSNVKVTATDKVTGKTWQVSHGEFIVWNAKLELVGTKPVEPIQGQEFNDVVATFRDTRAKGPDSIGHYKAIISWGEGPLVTISGAKAVKEGWIEQVGNVFKVHGRHTYQRSGSFTIHVKFLEDDGGRWHEASVFLNYRDGGMAEAFTKIMVYKDVEARELEHGRQALQGVCQEFAAGFGDAASNLWKFLNSDAINNQKVIAGAIRGTLQTFVTNPERAVQGMLDAVQEALVQQRTHPGRFLGGLTFDILLGKFGKLAQAKLISVGKKIPGLSNLNPNQGYSGLDPRVSAPMKELLDSPRSVLNRQILAGYVMRTGKIFDQINPWRLTPNCGNVAAAGVSALRDGVIHTASFTGPMYEAALEKTFGGKFSQYLHGPQFLANLQRATRPGSVGVVQIFDTSPRNLGHYLNYINMNGQLHFVDFQARMVYTDLQQYMQAIGFNPTRDSLRFLDCPK